MIDRAVRYVRRCALPNGAYEYDLRPIPRITGGEHINDVRTKEAVDTGADVIAVACPFCMQMFEDALNSLDPERNIRAADIAELVAEAIEDPT